MVPKSHTGTINGGAGLLAELGTRQINSSLSIRDAMAADPELSQEHSLVFTDQPDELQWNWGPTYTAKSIYVLLMGGGRIFWPLRQTWGYSIPPTVKIFIHLLLLDKILTREVMQRRNFHCSLECALCDSQEPETAKHLFFDCTIQCKCGWKCISWLPPTPFF